MADRGHADADQIVGRQLGHHFAIDIIVAKCGRVLSEPQPAQPRHDVHAAIPGFEERNAPPKGYSSAPWRANGPAEISACAMSRLQRRERLLLSLGITFQANQEWRVSIHPLPTFPATPVGFRFS